MYRVALPVLVRGGTLRMCSSLLFSLCRGAIVSHTPHTPRTQLKGGGGRSPGSVQQQDKSSCKLMFPYVVYYEIQEFAIINTET